MVWVNDGEAGPYCKHTKLDVIFNLKKIIGRVTTPLKRRKAAPDLNKKPSRSFKARRGEDGALLMLSRQ